MVIFILGLWFFDSQELLTDAEAVGILHFATYVLGLVGAVYVLHQLRYLGKSMLSMKLGCLCLGILGALVSLLQEGQANPPWEAIRVIQAASGGLVLLAVLIGAGTQLNILYYRNTPFQLPEIAVLTGSVVFITGSLRAVLYGASQLPAVDQNRFVGVALILIGIATSQRLLRTLRLEIDSLGLDLSKDDPDQALKRVIAYIMESIARLVSSKFGEQALAGIERRLNRRRPEEDPEFTFASIYAPPDSTANQIGELYRAKLVHVRQLIASIYGDRFATRAFDHVFRKIHWECKKMLDKYLFPHSPWAGRYDEEQALSGGERTRLIEAISMFHELAPNERQLLVRHSVVRPFRAGELIVRQGDYGDTCYIIARGEVQVEEQDATGEHRLIAFLRDGDFFGEAALLAHTPRMASVRATTDCQLLALSRDDFEKFGQQYPEMVHRIRDRLNNMRALLRIPLFGDLPPSVLRSVLPRIRAERHDAGAVVIKQGDMGKHFFLIKSGAVEVTVSSENREELICELGSREYFGEIALLKDIPRTASVRTTEPTELLVLDKEDFFQLVQGSRLFAQSVELVGQERFGNE